jgi:integrase
MQQIGWRYAALAGSEFKVETRVDAYGEEDVTKTAAGMREVPLGAEIVAALKKWKLRTRFKEPHHLIFPNRRGRYDNHDSMVKRKFLPLFDKLAKFHAAKPKRHPPAPFNWHALRHFAISCWIEAGLQPKTVQTFAGHSSLQVTMDRYGHLFKSDDHRKAMHAIARAMFASK